MQEIGHETMLDFWLWVVVLAFAVGVLVGAGLGEW